VHLALLRNVMATSLLKFTKEPLMPNKSMVKKSSASKEERIKKAQDSLAEAKQEEKGFINRLMPTMGKAARDQARAAQKELDSLMPREKMMEEVDPSEVITKKKGGMVMARGQGKVMKKRPTHLY